MFTRLQQRVHYEDGKEGGGGMGNLGDDVMMMVMESIRDTGKKSPVPRE